VLDQDLGTSGAGLSARAGFAELAAEVALGQVGIVLALEVSRLARNNADWYGWICAGHDILIGDADGLYHPGCSSRSCSDSNHVKAELHAPRACRNGASATKPPRRLRVACPLACVG
jgi:hypothetical protein